MSNKVECFLLSLICLVQPAHNNIYQIFASASIHRNYSLSGQLLVPAKPSYTKSLRFSIYTFTVAASDSGRTRNLQVKAFRGALLLTNFTMPVDGPVVGADVADLDNNRLPELYIYTTTDGSGSFGRIYAWQFLPERKADILLPAWQTQGLDGYMGHDSLWVEQNRLCRRFPVYRAGDANAAPSGGYQVRRYQLKPSKNEFALVGEP